MSMTKIDEMNIHVQVQSGMLNAAFIVIVPSSDEFTSHPPINAQK